MSGISTHILDTSLGRPAAGVSVSLQRLGSDGAYVSLGKGETNSDGRVSDLLGANAKTAGVYRLHFSVGDYFKAAGRPSFFPSVQLDFEITETQSHHHVPLLLSPFGFTTYRGS